MITKSVGVQIGKVNLEGDLNLPKGAKGLVIFAHGSGSSRRSTRNRFVANRFNEAEFATLLFDLLNVEEEAIDSYTSEYRFNISFLAERLERVVDWVEKQTYLKKLPIGLFGASTGAAAALIAATERPESVRVVVSRGGRPDLAEEALRNVSSPTLLIVGGEDFGVIELNQSALDLIPTPEKKLEIVPGATHLFKEPGALEEVAEFATDWFQTYMAQSKMQRRATG